MFHVKHRRAIFLRADAFSAIRRQCARPTEHFALSGRYDERTYVQFGEALRAPSVPLAPRRRDCRRLLLPAHVSQVVDKD